MIKLILLLLNLSLIIFSPSLVANPLPDLGSPDLSAYDAQTEAKLGRAFSTELHKHHPLVSDPEILNYVRNIGHKISSQTGVKRHFRFYVLDNKQINAFAGPNGIIGIHTGLIMAAKTEDELASVIAHEIAHVTQNHLSRRFHHQKDLSINSIASVIAAILIGSQDPDAGMAMLMGGVSLNTQQQLKHSRAHEYEADFIGIQYLYNAGYNPFAMGDFFGRLLKSNQFHEFKRPEILSTHPVTKSRLAKADNRAKLFLPLKTPEKNPQISLDLIKKRIHALNQTAKQDSFTKNLSKTNPHILCYKKNLTAFIKNANFNNNNINKTKTNFDLLCLEEAINTYPKERLLKLLKAQIQGIHHTNKAHQKFNYLHELFPRDPSIIVRHAKMWQKHQQESKAIQILTSLTSGFHYRYRLYKLTAELYSKQNKLDYAYYYAALANLHIGNIKHAEHLLEKSTLLTKNKNPNLISKIKRLTNNLP